MLLFDSGSHFDKKSKYFNLVYFVAKAQINSPLWVEQLLLQFNFFSGQDGGF